MYCKGTYFPDHGNVIFFWKKSGLILIELQHCEKICSKTGLKLKVFFKQELLIYEWLIKILLIKNLIKWRGDSIESCYLILAASRFLRLG